MLWEFVMNDSLKEEKKATVGFNFVFLAEKTGPEAATGTLASPLEGWTSSLSAWGNEHRTQKLGYRVPLVVEDLLLGWLYLGSRLCLQAPARLWVLLWSPLVMTGGSGWLAGWRLCWPGLKIT